MLRATAIPLLVIGLIGASSFSGFDLAVGANGESAAVRQVGGGLALLGRKPDGFAAEQWLRADADSHSPRDAAGGVACDELGCVARAIDGKLEALIEDCARAAIVVTPLFAPQGCGAPIVIDRRKLEETGAVTLRLTAARVEWTTARSRGEDRPWSRAPRPRPGLSPGDETEHDASAEEISAQAEP